MNKQSSGFSVTKLVVSLVVIVAASWVVVNRQAVIDQVRLLTYTPTAEARALAEANQFEQRGRDLFYASTPEVQDSAAFNASCDSHEQTIVLGCYRAQQIYLYNIVDERFNGIKEVTAAHEMLHAAYARLSGDERKSVNAMLKPIVEGMTDPRMLELIDLYNKHEPGELYNEMHSILGTEYASLTPDLEAYYKKYFQDRRVVVAFADQYQAIFTASKNKITEYDTRLGQLKPQIDEHNTRLQRLQAELERENTQLSQYRARDQIDQYNALVPAYNVKVVDFNTLIEQTKAMVAEHNQLVEERNNQVAAQANLYDSIDSNYQPATKN